MGSAAAAQKKPCKVVEPAADNSKRIPASASAAPKAELDTVALESLELDFGLDGDEVKSSGLTGPSIAAQQIQNPPASPTVPSPSPKGEGYRTPAIGLPMQEFAVHIEKQHQKDVFGLDVLVHKSGRFRVMNVKTGLVSRWNMNAEKALQVHAGDSIIEVNGVRGSRKDVIAAVGNKDVFVFDFVFIRPAWQFPINVPARSPELKLGLGAELIGHSLRISSISADGAVASWNATHPNKSVAIGDHVVYVNGVAEDTEAMVKAMMLPVALELVIQRPLPGDAAVAASLVASGNVPPCASFASAEETAASDGNVGALVRGPPASDHEVLT